MAGHRRQFNAPNKATGACSVWFGGCAGTGSLTTCAKKCSGQAVVRGRAFRGQAGARQRVQAPNRVTGEPTTFERRLKGGQFTGQPVIWKNVGGTILGYTPQQMLLAVGIGVAAFFLVKKFK